MYLLLSSPALKVRSKGSEEDPKLAFRQADFWSSPWTQEPLWPSGQAIVWRTKWSYLVISSSDISPRREAVFLSPQFRHLSHKFTKLSDLWTIPAVREPFPWYFPHNLIWKEKIKLSPTQNCQLNALKEFDGKGRKKKVLQSCSDEEITFTYVLRRDSKAYSTGQRTGM
jgi:hypothetical protein